jgi:sec-independent protein translocase protein TatA
MMNFGPIKLLFTAVAALLILGPKRIPSALRSLGKALGELKKASSEVSEQLKSGLDLEPEKPHVAPTAASAPSPAPPEEDLRPGPR